MPLEDRLRLRPTPEQYREFGDYLCEAHSWYKHLPLMEGRRFVVFVAPDAGSGRLVLVPDGPSPEAAPGYRLVAAPEGADFTEEHPRLHHGWQTTKEYRRRFGYLDYMSRRGPDEPYGRDAGPPLQLPEEVEERCGFVLYPYVSQSFAQAITWDVHEKALQELRAGAAHPARDEVLELARAAEALDAAWSDLAAADQDWLVARDTEGEQAAPGEPSPALRRYLATHARLHAIADSLRSREIQKIRRALTELDDWLLHSE
jgi:hypothetical protein